MAKSLQRKREKSKGPPDPANFRALRNWLSNKPREWSAVLAVRAALRVVPLLRLGEAPAAVAIPAFRALALAVLYAKFPNYVISRLDAFDAVQGAEVAGQKVDSDAVGGAIYAAANAARAVMAGGSGEIALAAARAIQEAIDAIHRFRAYIDTGAITAADSNLSERLGVKEILDAATHDITQLQGGQVHPSALATVPLWPEASPAASALLAEWKILRSRLAQDGDHWSVWFEWYEMVESGGVRDRAWHAAFSDFVGPLPWDLGPKAVNTVISRRLQTLSTDRTIEVPTTVDPSPPPKEEILSELAELASPQPSINALGQLDAGPNLPFDVPEGDDDLAELPFRQRNLIRNMLRDLPDNAPKHLKDFLRSYDDEVKARGAQPILGILKDDADIIAAAVAAPRAEDEWLQPGMRKAFDRFAENHQRITDHYPLDPEREKVYAATEIDEERVTMQTLEAPLAELAARTQDAHHAGVVTDDFKTAVDGIHEVSRVVATLPSSRRAPELKVSPEDRIAPISTKKRFIVRVTGFLKKATDQINDLSFSRTANALQIAEALRQALEKFLPFIK